MNVEGLGLISKKLLTNIADAIRKKAGGNVEMTPAEMPKVIKGITSSGIKFFHTKAIVAKIPYAVTLTKDVAPERLVYSSTSALYSNTASMSATVKALVGKTLIAIVMYRSNADGTENTYTISDGWVKLFEGADPKPYTADSDEAAEARHQFLAVFYKVADTEEEVFTFTATEANRCALGVIALNKATTPAVALVEGGTQADKKFFGDGGGPSLIAWHMQYAESSSKVQTASYIVSAPSDSNAAQRFAVVATNSGHTVIYTTKTSSACAAITIRI